MTMRRASLGEAGIGVSMRLGEAQKTFQAPSSEPGRGCTKRVIARDVAHSATEARFFCFGQVDGGVLTVRFTYRDTVIRIIGAGYWRQGREIYARQNQVHE